MFRHLVKMQLKADSFKPLSRKTEKINRWRLRRPKRLSAGMMGAPLKHPKAAENTFCSTKEAAEDYQKSAYLKVLETLSEIVTVTPSTVASEVSNEIEGK